MNSLELLINHLDDTVSPVDQYVVTFIDIVHGLK